MKIRSLILTLAVTLAGVMALPATSFAQDTYKSDPAHTSVLFRVKHFDFTYVYGQFLEHSATAKIDKEDPSKSSIEFTVKAESVFTNVKKRDDHLKSPDFLNVKQYPEITFKSKKIEKVTDTTFRVTGDFALHGTTKEITVLVEKTGEGQGPEKKDRIGFFTSFTIKRSDYGMKTMMGPASDQVHIILTMEGIKQ